MTDLLNKTCQLLGFDDEDRGVIYLFAFDDKPFDGYQPRLSRMLVAAASDEIVS